MSEERLEFERLGHEIPAAAAEAWRAYDPHDPQPGYYQFDWISSRYPDLYHRFALSSSGLMQELHRLVDLSNLSVVDVGAGTGRSACGLAKRAKHVVAVDRYRSVVRFGQQNAAHVGADNVHYVLADRSALPMQDSSVDAVVSCWAELDPSEAIRVVKPGGLLILAGAHPEAMSGELSAVLGTGQPPEEWFEATFRSHDQVLEGGLFTNDHDFTHVVDYGTAEESAAILGRIFGPPAADYMLQCQQATMTWRLRISWGRAKKSDRSTR